MTVTFNLKAAFYALTATFILALGMYIGNPLRETPDAPVPDTVQKEVKVPKVVRDTVTKEIPRTVTEYDTIRDTTVREIPTPAGLKVRGILPTSYLETGDEQFSVTYFDPDALRYRTETYSLLRPQNRFEIGMTGIGTSHLVFSGPHLKYQRPRWSVTAGYGIGVTRTGFYRSPLVMATVTFGAWDF